MPLARTAPRRGLAAIRRLNPLHLCVRPTCGILQRIRVAPESITSETLLERALLAELASMGPADATLLALERVEARHARGEDVGLARGASLLHDGLPGARDETATGA